MVCRTLRLERMPCVRRERWKRRNVGGRRVQSSVEGDHPSPDNTLNRAGRLADLLNPAGLSTERMAHEIRICGSTRMNRCRKANSNSLRNNLHGRLWGAWDGAVRRIAPTISSASLEIGRRALLVTYCRTPCRNIGT